ncbi:MAG: ABC transporter permease subunit [Spirochaetaceae bacterium]
MKNKYFTASLKRRFKLSIPLYILLLPAIIYTILLSYIPMYGITLAFKKFSMLKGIMGSDWVGLKHFARFIGSPQFGSIMKNTININILSLITFPIPIVLALVLNYSPSRRFKKVVQMITYMPHFISVVVLCSMVTLFLSVNTGVINNVIGHFGGDKINFMLIPGLFKHIFVGSGIWQSAGWSSIIYIASLSSVPPDLHEAAIIDGANKLQRIIHIDLPSIAPTIIIMFVLRIGKLMDLGFQKVYLLQNGANLGASEVISTYVYKVGLIQSNFSYSTAIELFNTVINIILLITANSVAKKLTKTSLF